MSNYILKSDEKQKKIVNINVNNSYTFNPKTKVKKFINVKSVTIYDEDKIENIIINKYTLRYNRIMKILEDLFSSDDSTDEDFMMCLNEVEKLKSILYNQYKKFIKNYIFNEFYENLVGIENYLGNYFIQKDVMSGYRGGR